MLVIRIGKTHTADQIDRFEAIYCEIISVHLYYRIVLISTLDIFLVLFSSVNLRDSSINSLFSMKRYKADNKHCRRMAVSTMWL